jgi:hypothetical protein
MSRTMSRTASRTVSRTVSRMMSRMMNWMTLAPGYTGALLLLQLVVVRALASVNEGRVFLAGREFGWECAFKRLFDFPCPTCGLTRSVLHTLHGQFGAAWRLNPAGLLLVSGLILLALALIFLSLQRRRLTPADSGALHRRIRIATKVYAHLLVALLFAHWIIESAVR